MKNKTFISFLINLLVGIIFSFPVFSVQLFAQVDYISNIECIVSNDETGSNIISDISDNTAKLSPKDKLNNFSNTKLIKKNSSPGKIDDTKINSLCFKAHTFLEILCDTQNLTFTFVNLSYLKDLKITKMLC